MNRKAIATLAERSIDSDKSRTKLTVCIEVYSKTVSTTIHGRPSKNASARRKSARFLPGRQC